MQSDVAGSTAAQGEAHCAATAAPNQPTGGANNERHALLSRLAFAEVECWSPQALHDDGRTSHRRVVFQVKYLIKRYRVF